jgi:hypothetical protein
MPRKNNGKKGGKRGAEKPAEPASRSSGRVKRANIQEEKKGDGDDDAEGHPSAAKKPRCV